jgi:hypothetical protein
MERHLSVPVYFSRTNERHRSLEAIPSMHEALGSIPSTTIKQYLKKAKSARCWRLTPIILVTQEAEIRRIEV